MTKVLYSLAGLGRLLDGESYKGAKCFIMLDGNTYEHCLPELVGAVEALTDAEFIELPVGEECKRIEIARQVWDVLLESGADRSSLIVNLGGGSVCDLGGFVAAGFKRGIRYINVPTTLIGMCDAAIGGKTAIDWETPGGLLKNEIGFFYKPEAVCIDRRFLATLDVAQLASGGFEVMKAFALADPQNYARLLDAGLGAISPAMLRSSVAIKQAVVRADPEEHGVRRILNFGHTFGHAIESYSYKQGTALPHGLAVGLGLMCAMYLSTKKLGMDKEVAERYACFTRDELRRVGLEPPRYTLKDTEPLLDYMRHDKKCSGESIRCVLIKEIGVPVIDVEVSELEVRDTLLSYSRCCCR
ncbi:MAG: 3-dehydroquinate synthase [Bacteroidales bacterium]|nr:3-dehydroquinate synthase [Bacteroidales bacterium]